MLISSIFFLAFGDFYKSLKGTSINFQKACSKNAFCIQLIENVQNDN